MFWNLNFYNHITEIAIVVTNFIGLMWELNEVVSVKYLSGCLEPIDSKCSYYYIFMNVEIKMHS